MGCVNLVLTGGSGLDSQGAVLERLRILVCWKVWVQRDLCFCPESGVESLECAVWNVQSGVWRKKVVGVYACHGSHSVGDRFSANASAPAGNQTD